MNEAFVPRDVHVKHEIEWQALRHDSQVPNDLEWIEMATALNLLPNLDGGQRTTDQQAQATGG